MRTVTVFCSIALSVFCLWPRTDASATPFDFEKVMITGDPAPGTGGTFTSVNSGAALNDQGNVVFSARATGQQTGPSTWLFSSGFIGDILLLGDPAPGLPGRTVTSAQHRGLNENNDIPMIGDVLGNVVTPPDDKTFWRRAGSGTIDLIGENGGTIAPGTTAAFTGFGSGFVPVMDADGDVAFRGNLLGTPFQSDLGIWAEDGGVLGLVAREGDPAPGTGQFFAGTFSEPGMNEDGDVAFFGFTETVPSGASNGPSGIWKTESGTLNAVAVSGQSVPEAGADREFTTFDNSTGINNDDTVAFIAATKNATTDQSDGESVWKQETGALQRVAQAGQQAPGAQAGFAFDRFSDVVVSGAGEALFQATALFPPAGPDVDGLWYETNSGLALAALEGEAAPGTNDGAVFSGSFNSATINQAGEVAFMGQLTGPGIDSDLGIFFVDKSGMQGLVVREGDLFEVVPGDFRTIEFLIFGVVGLASGNQDGRASAFNEVGQITFTAGFTDGSSGVFLATPEIGSVPEPGMAGMIALAIVLTMLNGKVRRKIVPAATA